MGQQCHRRCDLDGSRRTQSCSQRYVSSQSHAEAANRNAFLQHAPKHSSGVIAPMSAGISPQRSDLEASLFPVVCREKNCSIVVPRTDERQSTKVNRHWHHKPARIVGVFPNQIHTSRSREYMAILSKPLPVYL